MIDYFESNGAPKCPVEGNPAESMLKATLPSADGPNWHSIWRASPEYQEVKAELGHLRQGSAESKTSGAEGGEFASQHNEFVAYVRARPRLVHCSLTWLFRKLANLD